VSFSILSGSLPPGINMSSAGLISGMPTAAGTSNFTVRVMDSCAAGAQTVDRAFSATINPAACPALSITSPSILTVGIAEQGYSYQITTAGGQAPIIFSLASGSMPSGVSITPGGMITGAPKVAGTYSFTIQATDNCAGGAQNAQRMFILTINPQPSQPCAPLKIISLSLLTTGMVNQPYSYQTQTSGGQSPITFSLASGTLPLGLSLNSAGLISGTPNAPGNYSFAVMATDACRAGAQSAVHPCSIYVQPYQGTLSVLAVPTSFSIPRSESSALNIQYQFSGDPIMNSILSSPTGVFMVGDTTIEVNPTFLTVSVRQGIGRLSENISVPVRVLEEAMKRGSAGFVYKRTFSSLDGGIILNTTINFTITTEAGAAFEIRRIDLYFENRRPEITIPRNYPNLRAYADIRFVGSGLLQGFWEVDGRILSRIDRHLLYGSSVTLDTPEIPPFPTFDPGYHIVKFIITNPAVGIPLKEILYFVTTDEAPGKPAKLTLYTPENGDNIEYGPSTFTWEKPEKTAFFTIQFFEDPKSGPVFSAFTKEATYTLPESILQNSFSPGRKYSWKVTGFNDRSDVIAESESWSFTITAFQEYVKGQILVVFAESDFSEGLMREMREKYALTLIESYSLRALNNRMVLFGTLAKDIAELAEKLRKNKNIFLVQPNYIFRTMADPLCKNQYANTMLNIDKLHKVSMGRGVKVAVIDTGVDGDHDDLKARVSVKKNYVHGESYVPEIHGTAVAGVIAASINGNGIEGVAPEASIIALRACRQVSAENPEGECSTDSLARALDEAIEQRVHVANMSFGTPHYDSLLARLIDRGQEKGILFVAPASNVKNDKRLRFPASHPAVISVGGLDEQMNPYPNGDIAKASCACAPALNILTTVPGNKHNFMNGTSLSSAYISGLLALAIEKDKSVSKKTLPLYQGNICKWEEELLKTKICEK
jgi:subtilisin family serine protease